MTTGFQSNYKQNGYSLSTTWYNSQNVGIIGVGGTPDIYTSTQRTGVFMIDGTNYFNSLSPTSSNTYYPVNCSANDLINLGLPTDADDAWLVYPGYGFTLYYDYYAGITSRNYVNTSSVPVVYYCGGGGWAGRGTQILTTTGSSYQYHQTNSVRIYFRGTEIRVSGIA